ncbi:hypothetical protein F5I97DRAFT_710324 [Phlebopus sp. FC_14]|nr:hypothetical protein F5I97DRAFT_710324 [Phlebopus sp. FC_14]
MGTIKEYVDRAVQAGSDLLGLAHADPAIVLVATGATRSGLLQADSSVTSSESGVSFSPSNCLNQGSAYTPSLPYGNPTSPMCAPLIPRKLAKRKKALQGGRPHVNEITNRRIVSMPESKGKSPATRNDSGGRVVSMPERTKPALESSLELFPSPSTCDSYGPYDGQREHICISQAPSDVPQTPSPPSSPESLLIIDCGAQFPDGFLRRKYASDPLPEEDEDWVAWANSPPRPIPALHGPLSLPYARCPSGAEGTIIEEPDNVSRMIWGLGSNDQLPNQPRVDSVSPGPDVVMKTMSQAQTHVPPRLQKKRPAAGSQVGSQSQTPVPASKQYMKSTRLARTQGRPHSADERESPLEIRPVSGSSMQEKALSGLPWTEDFSPSTDIHGHDYHPNDTNNCPVDQSYLLDWQLALLRHALKNPSTDRDVYSIYSDGLEPIIPPTSVSTFPPPFPRIFVEPRANEIVSSAGRQSAVEIAQQYRQRQLYYQALQNQKTQQQNFLPTPPNSSSPIWSSHFSPYHGSSLSPNVAVSPDLQYSVSSQRYRSVADCSQQRRRLVHEHQDAFNLASSLDAHGISPAQSACPTGREYRQDVAPSSTLAKYLQQLQALSQSQSISQKPSPLPSVPSVPSLQSVPRGVPGCHSGSGSRQLAPMLTPPSPESPQSRSRSISYQQPRSIPLARLMQRRLSSVPEEDSSAIDYSSPPKLQNAEHQRSVSAHEAKEAQYLEVPIPQANRPRTPSPISLGECEASLPIFHHGTSPAKVRLPVVKEHEVVASGSLGGHHSHARGENNRKKKFRNKKSKWSTSMTGKPQPAGLVG